MNEVEILEKLVSFNTIEDKENMQILGYIEEYLKGFGFKTIVKTKILIMQYGKKRRSWIYRTLRYG